MYAFSQSGLCIRNYLGDLTGTSIEDVIRIYFPCFMCPERWLDARMTLACIIGIYRRTYPDSDCRPPVALACCRFVLLRAVPTSMSCACSANVIVGGHGMSPIVSHQPLTLASGGQAGQNSR